MTTSELRAIFVGEEGGGRVALVLEAVDGYGRRRQDPAEEEAARDRGEGTAMAEVVAETSAMRSGQRR